MRDCMVFEGIHLPAHLRQAIHELAGAHTVEEADLLTAEMRKQPNAQAIHHPLCCAIE